MNLYIEENKKDLSFKAFQLIKAIVVSKSNPVLGLATGSTPVQLYQYLIDDHKKQHTSYASVKTINLDEYIGLDPKNHLSYRYFMDENLFNHIDIDKNNTFIPNGTASDLVAECQRYNELTIKYPCDVQLLGLGNNGHIGFNEPLTPFDSHTRIVDLTKETIHANARFFTSIDDVPKKAITLGIDNIMKSKKIILLAFGKSKAKAVKAMIEDEMSVNCPASVLRNHPDVHIFLDNEAASLLSTKY